MRCLFAADVGGHGGLIEDLVDLLLRVSCKLILCGSDARDRCFQLFNAVYDLVLVCFHDVSSCDMV